MQTLIFLPTQGPHLPRTGPEALFDWRAQCRLAAKLQAERPEACIYVPSAFQQEGARSELEFYGEQLRAEGVPEEGMQLDARGLDTVEQCELALAAAASASARLIAVTGSTQARRVRYLTRGHEVEHFTVRGTTNRGLWFTHSVLGFVFPVLDHLGLREQWKAFVARRRLQGRQ
jgi:hypothetical protein